MYDEYDTHIKVFSLSAPPYEKLTSPYLTLS